jgi:hypothetical protein
MPLTGIILLHARTVETSMKTYKNFRSVVFQYSNAPVVRKSMIRKKKPRNVANKT